MLAAATGMRPAVQALVDAGADLHHANECALPTPFPPSLPY